MSPRILPNGKDKRQSSNPPLTTPHVALYMRVSSEDQAERGTIQSQRDFLRQFAHLYQLPIVEEYADDGVSDTVPLQERPDGQRLLRDADTGRFGCVLLYRVDRLGRSLTALLDAHTALAATGITIRSATEPFDTSTPIGTFLFQLLGSLAELEKATIVERTTLGRDRVARAGRWTGGTIPMGYDLDDQGLLVPSMRLVEPVGLTEAGFIEDLFQRIAAGSSALKECHRLNALGVSTVRRYAGGKVVDIGASWRPSRINKLLNNSVYIGLHRLKSQRGVIERAVPALIDQALLDAVQARLRANRCLPKNTVHRLYLLRSLITCGLCGARYIGTGVTRKSGRVTYYYRCSSQYSAYRSQLQERCRGKSLKAEWLEDFIWQDCRDFILNPGDALAEAKRQLDARRTQTASLDQEQRRLQLALAEKAVERERVMTFFRRGRSTLEEAEAQIDAIETEASQLRTLLTGLQAQHELTETFASHYDTTSTLLAALSADLGIVEQSNDLARKRQVVELLVAGILVDTLLKPGRKEVQVAITYRLTPKRAVSASTPAHSCRPR